MNISLHASICFYPADGCIWTGIQTSVLPALWSLMDCERVERWLCFGISKLSTCSMDPETAVVFAVTCWQQQWHLAQPPKLPPHVVPTYLDWVVSRQRSQTSWLVCQNSVFVRGGVNCWSCSVGSLFLFGLTIVYIPNLALLLYHVYIVVDIASVYRMVRFTTSKTCDIAQVFCLLCKNYFVKMTMSEGYCSFRVHWAGN